MSGFELEKRSLDCLSRAVTTLEAGFSHLPSVSKSPTSDARFDAVLQLAAERLHDNFPYFHPLYAGQMLKPPHPIARTAYALAMFVNPNNHALDGGRASSAMEKEAVAQIAAMFGFAQHLGHLTSGGTMANLEALWVAGKLRPSQSVLCSNQAHYTHERIGSVLGLSVEKIAVDRFGRMDMSALTARLERGGVGTVVATLGTTAIGSVDPLDEILALRQRFGFRVHVDAAYGGYFRLARTLEDPAARAFAAMSGADSIVVDPHKHGLQPYGCGCVLFADPGVGAHYKHDSPYTYFSSNEMHLGEISLECSRAGAAAVALWSTQHLLPLERGGEFARDLEKCLSSARALHERLNSDERFIATFAPQLDIVVWAVRGASVSESSALASRIFDEAAKHDLHLALAELPCALLHLEASGMRVDKPTVKCLRSVLMKPEHLDWIDEIWKRLDAATSTVSRAR